MRSSSEGSAGQDVDPPHFGSSCSASRIGSSRGRCQGEWQGGGMGIRVDFTESGLGILVWILVTSSPTTCQGSPKGALSRPFQPCTQQWSLCPCLGTPATTACGQSASLQRGVGWGSGMSPARCRLLLGSSMFAGSQQT